MPFQFAESAGTKYFRGIKLIVGCIGIVVFLAFELGISNQIKIKVSFITDDKRKTGRSQLTRPQLRPIT